MNIYKMLMAVIGVLLFWAAVVDLRKKQVGGGMLLVMLAVCCAAAPFRADSGMVSAAAGLAPGLCAIGLSVATREQIGMGDGIVIAALGLALGVRRCLLMVCAGAFVMGVAAILVLLFHKGGRQTRLPFLPAVFVGYLLCAL